MIIIPGLLEPAQLQQLLHTLSQVSFVDGAHSAGPASRYQKNNLQSDPRDQHAIQAAALVQQCLEQNPMFKTLAMPRRVRTVVFNIYAQGMYYRDHVDHSILPGKPPLRGDLSMTLFLSEPDSYGGGELVINSDDPGQVSMKLPAGHAVIYNADTMHRVNPVTNGRRLAAITTIESLVADPVQRKLLGEMAS